MNDCWPDLHWSIGHPHFQEILRLLKAVAEHAVSSTLSSGNGCACHAHDCVDRH